MGSLERHDGFKKIADDLIEQKKKIARTPAAQVKDKILKDLEWEIKLYKGMYMAEMDIYTGLIDREPQKYILASDNFTFIRNPEWYPMKEID
jgi:hypothetical protein